MTDYHVWQTKRSILILGSLLFLGAGLRFYNLNWDDGFFFHPDERNIASSVAQLSFPGQLNPHFFAYGAFPIYLIYVLGVAQNLIVSHFPIIQSAGPSIFKVGFAPAILIGRGLSAFLSTLMILLVYLLTRRLLENMGGIESLGRQRRLALLAAALTTVLPGLIQFAHFSTFETFLTFEYLLVFWFALNLVNKGHWWNYWWLAVVTGLSIATKVVSLVMLVILPITHWLAERTNQNSQFKKLVSGRLIITLVVSLLVALMASPFNFLDLNGFEKSMAYEGGVARGTLPVFYTGHFVKTWPVVYQTVHVFPYLLGWPLIALGGMAFLWAGWFLAAGLKEGGEWKKKKGTLVLLLAVPGLYLLFHFTLFVKWVRYMVPALPFIVILVVVFLDQVFSFAQTRLVNSKTRQKIIAGGWVLVVFLLSYTAYQGFSFFAIYTRPDTRIQAAEWAGKNLPRNAKIISEVWDLGIVPFNNQFPVANIKLFNAYELDGSHGKVESEKQEDRFRQQELKRLLAWADYIVIPSQRIFDSRLSRPDLFPDGAKYYQDLLAGRLGFVEVAEFNNQPCFSNECHWIPDEKRAEQTFKVFDHPQVTIFQKIK